MKNMSTDVESKEVFREQVGNDKRATLLRHARVGKGGKKR